MPFNRPSAYPGTSEAAKSVGAGHPAHPLINGSSKRIGTIHTEGRVKTTHLFRHVSNEGDVLTPEGVTAAVALGRGLAGGYSLAASSEAGRTTQTVGRLLAGMGQPVPLGVTVVEALRSEDEERGSSLAPGLVAVFLNDDR